MNRRIMRRSTVVGSAALALVLSACGGGNEAASTGGTNGGSAVSGEVIVDGSSTVQPLTAAAGELFKEQAPGVNVSVATSGTGGGFKVFCQGSTDISNASRPIKDEEAAVCKQNGVEYVELQVATDALTVVVSKDNSFITCLTTKELATMWGPEATGKVKTWKQVNASFPDQPLELYGAGTDSGTFDYFTDAINGEEGASRTDYNATEDDNVTVSGVGGSTNAVGYFGFTYYEENADKLKAVQIDNGKGCVTPSSETAQDGSYSPLSRPLFIYVSKKAASTKPQVKAFIDFYAKNDGQIAEAAKFIALNEEQKAKLVAEASKLS